MEKQYVHFFLSLLAITLHYYYLDGVRIPLEGTGNFLYSVSMYNNVRGFKDLSPQEYEKHGVITGIASSVSKKYGFVAMDLPMVEYTDIFSASMGATSDVINKEIYSFQDKSGNSIALRPEFTAGVKKYVINNNLLLQLPLRFFLYGSLFRYDRPQKGRQREFTQINFEHIGVQDPLADVQMIKMASDILDALQISANITLEVNSLGCDVSIKNYQGVLCEYFDKYYNCLSEDSQCRLNKRNPLRILDSKSLQDREIILNAPKINRSYTKESVLYLEQLMQYLDMYSISYKLNPVLVRGLDYYRYTVFEFKTDALGAQSTLCAGGKYFIEHSNIQTACVGCAAGVERLAMLMSNLDSPTLEKIVIIPLDASYNLYATRIFNSLLSLVNFSIMIESEGTLKSRMKRANRLQAKWVILIGKTEVEQSEYTIRCLQSGEEEKCSLENLVKFFNVTP